ncbi:hypothetical protein BASA62_002561 [Batrachochytrium salamandrivorans]|nr:hypothetical protein BASA62_002561 [Batrachochytrium salamandrivorans]
MLIASEIESTLNIWIVRWFRRRTPSVNSLRGSRTTPCSSCSNHIPPSLSRSNRSNCYIQLLGCASRRCIGDTDTDTDIHQLTSQFLESANAVADNLSLRLSPPATRSNRRLLSGTTKRAILASNTARQAFIAAATNPTLTQSSATLFEMSGLDSRLLPPNSREWMVANNGSSTLTISTALYQTVEPISYSAAARAMSGNSSRSAAVTPLYNSDGIVQYDPTSILRVMQGHYGSLAADTTGHSLDLQYWHDRQPIQVSPQYTTIRNSDILDQDFSWNQIAAALLQMSPRKAPGDDGITTAFYQAALYMPANTQEGVPPTPFARALLRVCGQVFASATIPRAWLCASIVSIDKKDGDPLNPGDKRGIALINVGLKLVCKVLQMRIERFVETNNLLSYEQAGFRKREECVGQVVSLVDIIQRRQNAGLNTHVLFIDIRDNDVFTLNVQGQLVRSQRWFWSRRTKQLYRNRYWLTPQVRPKTVKQRHSFALMETLRTCGDSASLQNTSIAHLVVECEQVTGHRIQSGLVPVIQKSRLRLLGRALDPGVENVYTWLRGGVLNGEADLDQRWLDGNVEHESMGTRHDNRALAARLADFLQVAYRQYQSTLWKYHRDRLVEVG